jgi:hypothetical protein
MTPDPDATADRARLAEALAWARRVLVAFARTTPGLDARALSTLRALTLVLGPASPGSADRSPGWPLRRRLAP